MASAQTLLTNLEAKRGKAYYDEFVALMSQVISDYATVSDRFIATSTSAVTVGSGTKAFTLSATGKSFSVGSYVMAFKTTDPTVYMIGQVTAFVDPALTISVASTSYGGSGSVSAWTIALSAAPINGDARYVQSSGGNASAAVVTPSGGSSALSLAAALGQWINVKWFGAKGDGTTDDTAAIQAAVARAGLVGGTVVFPDGGTYCISSEIVAKITTDIPTAPAGEIQFGADVVVHLLGEGLATLKATAAMTNMVRYVYDSEDSDIAPFFSNVEGLTFDGNNLATSGLFADYALGLKVERNRFLNLTNGISVNGYGVMRVLFNVFRTLNGINFSGGGGDSFIQHNDFFCTTGGTGIYMGSVSGNTVIAANIFNRIQSTGALYGISIDGTTATTAVRHITIENNEFYGQDVSVLGQGNAAARNVWSCILRGNHVTPPSTGSFTGTLAQLTKCDDFQIVGNFIGGYSLVDASTGGLLLTDCARTLIAENNFSRFTSTAMVLDGCVGTQAVNNSFNDCGKASTSTPIISVTGAASSRNVICDNAFWQWSTSYGQIGVQEGTGVTGTLAERNTFTNVGEPYRRASTSTLRRVEFGAAVPSTGTWNAGDQVINTAPAIGGTLGWICTTGGTPGTWVKFGPILTSSGYASFGDIMSNGAWVNTVSGTQPQMWQARYTGNDNSGPVALFIKSRNNGIVSAGDPFGALTFYGSDGAANQLGAQIVAYCDGTPGSGVMPGRLALFTTPAGSATPLERLRVNADGSLGHRANATTVVDANSHLGLRSYTVATLPSASTAARLINVSDGASNKRLAISDGTNWRWPDGATVS